jgi:hypothetical protein
MMDVNNLDKIRKSMNSKSNKKKPHRHTIPAMDPNLGNFAGQHPNKPNPNDIRPQNLLILSLLQPPIIPLQPKHKFLIIRIKQRR